MFRRMRCFIGFDADSGIPKRLISAKGSTGRRRRIEFKPPDMLETVHEIAIYIHRFHNLDLFQQGWYQIKISMRWEDSSRGTRGTPARVVQYEAPNLSSENIFGVWRIDDAEQSFSTQPFRIKYARQDVLLSVMVSFNLNIGQDEKPSTSAVILKFELMYVPILESGLEMQSLDAYPAAVHEFRIPPKALLGLHSYCPVHFDVFHAVLVDLSIHIALLKAGSSTPSQKVPSMSHMAENVAGKHYEGPNQVLSEGVGSRAIELIKSLLISRELLLEDIEKISRAIGRTVDDLSAADLDLGSFEFIGSASRPDLSTAGRESRDSSGKKKAGQLAGMLGNILEKSNGTIEVENDVMLYSLSKEELLDVFLSVGNQVSFIWNVFLKFHRTNRMEVLQYLYDVWAVDRKTEWSIWMVHSKIDIPHRYLRSADDDSSYRNSLGKVVIRKSNDEQAQCSATRAELHRKSIAQMKINNRCIQDMHIFGDPSHAPVILIEQHVMNVPLHGSAKKMSFNSMGQNDSLAIPKGDSVIPNSRRNGCLLKAVIFVHGFQDIDCMPLNPLENLPEALRRQNVGIYKFCSSFADIKLEGQPKEWKIGHATKSAPSESSEIADGSSYISPPNYPMNTLMKQAKGDTIDAIVQAKATVNEVVVAAQQAMYSQPCTLAQIQAREADIRALAELARSLDKKEALLIELRHMNEEVSGNQKDSCPIIDLENFRKQYAMVLLQLRDANDQVASALLYMRQRNTYPGNSTPPWHKPIESFVGPVTHQGSFNPALLTQDSGSNILEIIQSSRQKARTMVDVAVQECPWTS